MASLNNLFWLYIWYQSHTFSQCNQSASFIWIVVECLPLDTFIRFDVHSIIQLWQKVWIADSLKDVARMSKCLIHRCIFDYLHISVAWGHICILGLDTAQTRSQSWMIYKSNQILKKRSKWWCYCQIVGSAGNAELKVIVMKTMKSFQHLSLFVFS